MEANWNETRQDMDGLWVRLNEEPDAVWRDVFADVASPMNRETRGQTWEAIELSIDGRALFVPALDPDTDPENLKSYAADLLAAVDRAAEVERTRRAETVEDERQRAEERSEGIGRLQQELRDDS